MTIRLGNWKFLISLKLKEPLNVNVSMNFFFGSIPLDLPKSGIYMVRT